MFKNGMRPVHPGEVLVEDYIKPMGVSVRAVALEKWFRLIGQPNRWLKWSLA